MNKAVLTLALTIGTAAFAQDDTIPTAQGSVVIHPIGHASVLLTWNGKKILVDPAPGFGGTRGGGGRGTGGGRGGNGARGAAPPPPPEVITRFKELGTADLILATHAHGDHFNPGLLAAIAGPETVLAVAQIVYDGFPEALKGNSTIMANGDTSILAGIEVYAVPAYNVRPERLRNHPEGVGNGYVLNLGGKRFYFAGDTEETPELAHLANIDVAFVPMNQPTETPEAAVKWVRDFRPRIVYPYHFSNGDLSAFTPGVGDTSEVRVRKWY
jgi:L-ascorbate metabolism protein UlaG (beta-lactamase superfamily)